MMSNYRIRAKPKNSEWLGGTINEFRFEAKVYDVGSIHGIDNGRVSKLAVWNPANQPTRYIISYDRGWDAEPADDVRCKLLQALLEFLDAFPIREDWRTGKHYKNGRWSK